MSGRLRHCTRPSNFKTHLMRRSFSYQNKMQKRIIRKKTNRGGGEYRQFSPVAGNLNTGYVFDELEKKQEEKYFSTE